ncbi:pre-mRNA processing factor 3-domain-containing protein [Halteromyces radiatus]|uniref:pre-mRNA processing factor 3-domain-containing protein n=1 Tax=Halteromyces radiatus TaxID=101107 RepID=UPI00221E517D|nr:pre-mRNA processing factor 3-domain-containing protein [Halteromyces radiatus]KAI8092931.1 pre-mRNA processing factor 3-domain-containing protein [Halteromyces radiatus]
MSDPSQAAAIIAAKRAEVLAKLAKFQNNNTTNTALPRPPSTTSSRSQSHVPTQSSTTTPSQPISGLSLSEIQRKREEVMNRLKAGGIHPGDKKAAPPPMPLDASGNFDLRAMLDKGIIPKREKEIGASSRTASPSKQLQQKQQKQPASAASTTTSKPTTLKMETTPESFTDPTKNPYYDPSLPVNVAPKGRRSRAFKFIQPGKYIEKGNQERAKAQLERLKEEVAAKVKQAGMETEMDISDKVLKKEPPPVAEWWDAPFLPNQTYQDLDDQPVDPQQLTSLVTIYVHHPVPIKAPSDLNGKPPSRALMLTKKERKKLRRQRRLETQKDKQDKIRLGLLPPDPPKVKISNLMKVLGDEAIQDPTKVEAKVRKEMEERQKQHDLANEQRKLTPAERRAKLMNKIATDQNTANEVAVFKIKNCAHPKHRYKIEKNAQQFGLTGIVIVHPKCHMVIVEGGPKSIKAYKKLMLRRIDWNDMPVPKNLDATSMMDLDDDTNNNKMVGDGDNKCYLVWTGQVKNKAFKKFTWRSFESEKMARQELTKWHAENYWDAALLSTDEELAMRQPEL